MSETDNWNRLSDVAPAMTPTPSPRTAAGRALLDKAQRARAGDLYILVAEIMAAVPEIERDATDNAMLAADNIQAMHRAEAAPAGGLREALLVAVEEVNLSWHEEDGEVRYREGMWDNLIALRKAYNAYEDDQPALAASLSAAPLDAERLADAVERVETEQPDLEPGIVGLRWEKAVIAAYERDEVAE